MADFLPIIYCAGWFAVGVIVAIIIERAERKNIHWPNGDCNETEELYFKSVEKRVCLEMEVRKLQEKLDAQQRVEIDGEIRTPIA